MELFLEKTIALAILVIINVIGIITSGLLMCVLLRNQKIRNIPGRAYLLSLASVTIFLLIIGVPFFMTAFIQDIYPFGNAICKISQYIFQVSNGITYFTIAALSIESYFNFRKASHQIQDYYDERIQSRRQTAIVAAIWISFALLAIPVIFGAIVAELNTGSVCVYAPISLDKYSVGIGLTYIIGFYFLPAALILIFTILTAGLLCCCKPRITASHEDREIFTGQLQEAKKAAGLVLFVCVLFIIYFLPHFSFSNLIFFDNYMEFLAPCFTFTYNSIAVIGLVLISNDLRGLCAKMLCCK